MNIFDSSSFYLALRQKSVHLLKNTTNQALLKYELGHILWKEINITKSISKAEGMTVLAFMQKIFNTMRFIQPHPNSILSLASELNISYYEASYVQLAKEKHMPLITEDKKLQHSAGQIVKVLSLEDIA